MLVCIMIKHSRLMHHITLCNDFVVDFDIKPYLKTHHHSKEAYTIMLEVFASMSKLRSIIAYTGH